MHLPYLFLKGENGMGKYEAILFDMDGTLVPMDMGEFTNGYFKDLYKKVSEAGIKIEADSFVAAVWGGTKAMVLNDGSRKNRDAFWEKFEEMTGLSAEIVDKQCLDFYTHEFVDAKRFTKDNPLAKEAVRLAHEKSCKVALATNPLFPMVGQITRLGWIDLKPSDFCLVTSYEEDCYCKPNPMYFASVCERIGVKPENCLMIGNDENEDMYAAGKLNMDCYLVTDTMIPSKDHPFNGKRGSFSELCEFLRSL